MAYTQYQVQRAIRAARIEMISLVSGILFVLVWLTGLGFLVAGYDPAWLIAAVSVMFGWMARAFATAYVNG